MAKILPASEVYGRPNLLVDMLRTSTTYKTRKGALAKLEKETTESSEKFCYVIAVNEEGRFAPVVFLTRDQAMFVGDLAHRGITVVA